MSRKNSKQFIEQEYRASFVPAEETMQHVKEESTPDSCPATGNNRIVVTAEDQQHHDNPLLTDPSTSEATEAMDTKTPSTGSTEQLDDIVMSSEVSKFRKHFLKKPGTVVDRKKNEKERKARHLRRMRKWLMPKNAIVALHELQGPGMTEFITNTVGHLTKAEIVVNNVKYEAIASSKNQAKAKVCEKALRDLAISQMTRLKQHQQARTGTAVAANKTVPPVTPPVAPPVAPPAPSMSESDANGDSASEIDMDEGCESDDLPIEHLAAFALHKLFTEWENEGFEVPTLKPARTVTTTTGVPSMPKVTKTVADLPPDAATRHPTALFAYMRPQVAYKDLGSNEDPLNREFTASIDVDGQEFIGRGRSKKLARKAAAIDACKTLFGVEFDSSVL